MITVISVYNNRQIFNDCLSVSLSSQTAVFQSILIDNTTGANKCGAKVFNEVINRARGDFLLFCHQDVVFKNSIWLSDVEKELALLTNPGVVGVAGCKEKTKGVFTNIVHGPNRTFAGEYRVTVPTKVQTVDECLFIVPQDIFSHIQFDELTCFGWHFYAADLCLSCILAGYTCYVIPVELYHLSAGSSLDISYYKTGRLLANKYRSSFSSINTTCSTWRTKYSVAQYYMYLAKYAISNTKAYPFLKKYRNELVGRLIDRKL